MNENIETLNAEYQILRRTITNLTYRLFYQSNNMNHKDNCFTDFTDNHQQLQQMSKDHIEVYDIEILGRITSYVQKLSELRLKISTLEEQRRCISNIENWKAQRQVNDIFLNKLSTVSKMKQERSKDRKRIKKIEDKLDDLIDDDTAVNVNVLIDSVNREISGGRNEVDSSRMQNDLHDSMRQDILGILSEPILVNNLQLSDDKKHKMADIIISGVTTVSSPSSSSPPPPSSPEKCVEIMNELPTVPAHTPL